MLINKQAKLRLELFVSLLFCFAIFAGQAQSQGSLTWKNVAGVSIPIPPSVHPRLCFRAENIPDIKTRMRDPSLTKVWSTLQSMTQDWLPSQIPAVIDYRFYYKDKGSPIRAQLSALNYLVSKDTTLGRNAITLML
ncbi:MAG TPA: heparinase, partial [Paludibacter sp.]|nr:heparinase [Paludibacter sp.]